MTRLNEVPTPEPTTTRLTRAAVLDEAMRVLDDDGLDSLTMRRLAERLGVVPMAIYRHVSNKDDLIEALLDRAVSKVPIPDPSLDWRAGLGQLAVAIRRTMLEHPGIVAPLVTRPSIGEHALAIGEYGRSLMLGAGFSEDDAERGPNAVLTYTIGFVALEVPRRQAEPPSRASEFVGDAQFTYGLDRLLDGIASTAVSEKPRRRRIRTLPTMNDDGTTP